MEALNTPAISQKTSLPVVALLLLFLSGIIAFSVTAHYTVAPNPLQDRQLKMEKKSGRNDPHANQNARNQAEKEFEKVKQEYQEWSRKPNKTPKDKKYIEKLRKQLERLRKKKDFSGETHSRTPKVK